MLTIAFCSHQESMLKRSSQEIIKGFSRRGIDAKTLLIENSEDLLIHAKPGTFPDIIIFSNSIISRNFLNALLFLKEQKHSIIFILSKDSESFNLSMEDDYTFLLQPFYYTSSDSHHELWNCVCKAYDLIITDQNTFSYYHRPFYHSAPLNRILYFASEGRCIRLVTPSDSDSFYGRLCDLEESLTVKNCRFIRIHQSYLVNARYISAYDRKTVTLSDGSILPISKCEYYHMLRKKVPY